MTPPAGSSTPGTATGVTPPTGSGGGTVKALGAWEDFAAWWAEQTEKAKNAQDQWAKDQKAAAEATRDPVQIQATNAMLADREALAKSENCASAATCDTQAMKDFMSVVKNVKDISPAEKLEFYERLAKNICEFTVDSSNETVRNGGYKDVLRNIVKSLAKSTAEGKKHGATTAEEMWGKTAGYNLNHDQRQAMSNIQKSILFGKGTAAQWRELLNGTTWDNLWNSIKSFVGATDLNILLATFAIDLGVAIVGGLALYTLTFGGVAYMVPVSQTIAGGVGGILGRIISNIQSGRPPTEGIAVNAAVGVFVGGLPQGAGVQWNNTPLGNPVINIPKTAFNVTGNAIAAYGLSNPNLTCFPKPKC